MIPTRHRYILFAVVLALISVVIVTLSVDDADAEKGTVGDIDWDYTDGTLTMSGTGEVKCFPMERKYEDEIEMLVFDEGITGIVSYCFYDMKNLKEIRLPKSLSTIGDGNFNHLPSLEYINVSAPNPYFKSERGIMYDADMTVLYRYPSAKQNSEYVMPETVTKIRSYAFDKYIQLDRIRLSPNLSDDFIGLYFKAGYVYINNQVTKQCRGESRWVSLVLVDDPPRHVKSISNGYDVYRFYIEGLDHFDGTVTVSIEGSYITYQGRSAYVLPEEGDPIEYKSSTDHDGWSIRLDRSAYFVMMAKDFKFPLDIQIMIGGIIIGTVLAIRYIRRNGLI